MPTRERNMGNRLLSFHIYSVDEEEEEEEENVAWCFFFFWFGHPRMFCEETKTKNHSPPHTITTKQSL